MPLEASQVQKFTEWLKTKVPSHICPVCHQADAGWEMEGVIASPVLGSSSQPRGETLPIVAMVCRNCAHIQFFSATAAGVVEP